MADDKDSKKRFRFEPGQAILAAVVTAVVIAAVILNVQHRRMGRGTVMIGEDINVRVEIASTAEMRQKGLSGHEPLGPSEGMLFIFPIADAYAFWMKDMSFPIDILWIKGDELVDMTVNVQVSKPDEAIPRFFPKYPADKVLEVQAGFAKAHGLRIGMPVHTVIDKK